jgi:uncharacterized protein YbjQ (UPF0145 family)
MDSFTRKDKVMTIISELSANELYCLTQKNYQLGSIVIGNAIQSLGLSDTIESSLGGMVGLEVTSMTKMLNAGRQNAFKRLMEGMSVGAVGVINVKSKLQFHENNLEFLTTGSVINREQHADKPFSFGNDGRELYALLDAGYMPVSFVFGTVAYSTYQTGGLIGKLRSYRRGEVNNLSVIFNQTRQISLQRIISQAKEANASAVLGIDTVTLPFTGVNEMLMSGSAVHHPLFTGNNDMVSSTLSIDETWMLAKMGYAPRRLLLGSSVFSLGLMGNISAAIKSFYLNEIPELTQLFAKARNSALAVIDNQAKAINAQEVIGVSTKLFHLGNGLIEFLAMGTAIEKMPGIKTQSDSLPLPFFSRITYPGTF